MEGRNGPPVSQRTGLILKLSRQKKNNFEGVRSETCLKKVPKWVVSYNTSDNKTHGADKNQTSVICSTNISAGCSKNTSETEKFSLVLNHSSTKPEENTVGKHTGNEKTNSGKNDVIDNDQPSQICVVNSPAGIDTKIINNEDKNFNPLIKKLPTEVDSVFDVSLTEAESGHELIDDPSIINKDTASLIRAQAETDEFDSPFDDSDADPNYSSSSSTSSSSSSSSSSLAIEEVKEKKARKRKLKPEAWKKNIAKRRRNAGLEYVSTSKTKKIIKAREIGPPCDKCRLKCNENITADERKLIFSDYWNMGDLQRQRHFLSKCIEPVKPKYQYIKINGSNRANNNAFYFLLRGNKIRVCKKFFRSTLGITDRPIRTVIQKQDSFTKGIISNDMRGKHGHHHHVDNEIKADIRNHIQSIPRIESHYCRKESSREFIEGSKTVADLHRDYVNMCKESNKPYANYLMYSRIFNSEFNISFFIPKKDQCGDCVSFEIASADEKPNLVSDYETHLLEKDLSRQEKKTDKESSADNVIVAVYDLQAVLQCPRGETSSFYYASKLNVFNFTIFELKTKEVQCYMWDELEANRGVCEIGTCVLNYIKSLESRALKMENKNIDLIFYSDNCCGQQKNHVMFTMYLYAVQMYDFINTITHKFLIKGHSQNEGDSVHSVIERHIKRSLKSGPIFVPNQYVTIVRTSKMTGNPYQVHELCHEDFLDLKDLASKTARSFTRNSKNETIKITDLKVVRAEKDQPNKLYYKTSYADQYQIIDIKCSRNSKDTNIKRLYKTKPGIPEKKKISILGLFKQNKNKSVIPKNYFPYYNSLKVK